MTPGTQRISIGIAKACGWTQIENANTMAIGGIWRGYPPTGQVIGKKDYLPDYLNDLNAMHEAEKVLIEQGKWSEYKNDLWRIFTASEPWPDCEFNGDDMTFATAAQRAEAFLRTLGLWKE